MGEPPHQLYSFAIKVWFSANASGCLVLGLVTAVQAAVTYHPYHSPDKSGPQTSSAHSFYMPHQYIGILLCVLQLRNIVYDILQTSPTPKE